MFKMKEMTKSEGFLFLSSALVVAITYMLNII